jgi:hypothetical protein
MFGNASGRLCAWPAYLLFFLMLVFPTLFHFLYVKAFLFALLLAFVAIQSLGRLRLHPQIVLWTFFLSAVSLFFGLRGLFLGAPGAGNCIQIYAMWPLVYMVLLSGINVRILQGLEKTLLLATVFIAVFLAFFLLSELKIVPPIPHLDWIFTQEELNSGGVFAALFYQEHVETMFPAVGSLPFLVPFLMAAAVSRGPQSHEGWISRRWGFVALLLSLPIVVFSGRRALQLVVMLAPFGILALGLFQPRKERQLLLKSLGRVTAVLLVVAVLSVPLLRPVYAITFEGITDRFFTGFDFSPSNRADNAVGRIDQYLALMDGWQRDPFIGNGLGAVAHTSIRSESIPWLYELCYVDLLFATGLLGFAAYTAGIMWIYWSGIKIIKHGAAGGQFMLAALVGMTGLLIANGTNPYLARFDGIWAIFLPLAFINHWRVTRQNAQDPT